MVRLGIDFGTSTTVVAFSDQSGTRLFCDPASAIVKDPEDKEIIPSFVSLLPNGRVVTGRTAKARRAMDPANTIHSFKRMIGLPWSSAAVAEFMKWYPVDLECGAHKVPRFPTRAGELSAVDVAAYFLSALREHEAIRAASQQPVTISVPVSFTSERADAILDAAARAGFVEANLVNEAYAAAIPFITKKPSTDLVAVYDLGGGTFDFALLQCAGISHEVIAFGGDPYLGGDDVDLRLADWAADEVLARFHWDLRADNHRFKRLVWACEKTKVHLSTLDETELWLEQVDPTLARKSIAVHREYLEKLLYDLVQRTFVVCDDVLARANLHAKSINTLVLAGGTSYIPYVRAAVEQYFGKPPVATLPPDKIVAMGASLYASQAGTGLRRANGA